MIRLLTSSRPPMAMSAATAAQTEIAAIKVAAPKSR